MAVVFVAGVRADQDLAARIVNGLREAGIQTWSRDDMPGLDWAQALQRQIEDVGAVVALWTPASREDEDVRKAAGTALAAGKLVNAAAGSTAPFPFGSVEAVTLDDWTGGAGHADWTRLLDLAGSGGAAAESSSADGKPAAPAAAGAQAREAQPHDGGGTGQTPGPAGTTGSFLGVKDDDFERFVKSASGGFWLTARRIVAVGVAIVAVSIFVTALAAFGHYPNANLRSEAVMIPVVLLGFAFFLWREWK